jgi:xanthine phosphoribosyltransferase
MVDKKYILPGENILIIDDFLANGNAARGLADIVASGNAVLAGVGAVIEKGFQDGRKMLQEKGIQVESLVIIKEFCDNKVVFDR